MTAGKFPVAAISSGLILGEFTVKRNFIVFLILLTLAATALRLHQSSSNRISRLLGGKEYVRLISAPDSAEMLLTTDLLAQITNAPLSERSKVEQPTTLPESASRTIGVILVDPDTYDSQPPGDTTTPPEIILRLKRGPKNISLEFSDDFRTMLIRYNDGHWKLLNCQTAKHDLELALGPFLEKRPPFWHSNPGTQNH